MVRGVYVPYRYVSRFPQSHPTQQARSPCCYYCSLSVCLLYICFSVVVHTLLYTFSIRRGNLGGFRRGVREGVSRVDSQPLDQPKITLLYLYCVYLSLFCGFGMGSYLPGEGKGGLVGLGRVRYYRYIGGWMVFGE